jgi:hypothetical protein
MVDPVDETLARIGMGDIVVGLVISSDLLFIRHILREEESAGAAAEDGKILAGNAMVLHDAVFPDIGVSTAGASVVSFHP